MALFSLVLNILWIVCGGLWMAAAWVIAGILLALTIVGLPWARAAFNIAAYTLLPFGYRVVPRDAYTGRVDLGIGRAGNRPTLFASCGSERGNHPLASPLVKWLLAAAPGNPAASRLRRASAGDNIVWPNG